MSQTPPSFTVSDAAAARLREVLKAGERLRLSVSGGGCSGFQYGMLADATLNADDRVFGTPGAEVVIDGISLPLLLGSQLDYTAELMGAAFTVNNPNATARCGCGNSFSV